MSRFTFFFRLFVWFSLRHMARHPRRTLAVLIGVALGAAVFTSVRLSVHASLDSFTRSMDRIAGAADRVVAKPGGRVDESVLPRLLAHPAVESASPFLSAYVTIGENPETEPFLLVGFDPILDRPVRDWEARKDAGSKAAPWLDLIKTPFTLVMGESLAADVGAAAGETRVLDHVGKQRAFRVLGVLASRGPALADGGRLAVTDIASFQEFTGIFGSADRIDLVFSRDVSESDAEAVKALLGPDLQMDSPSREKESGLRMIRSYQLNLSVLSFASLFVGMFLVYSLVALNAASRRRELAILRSVGASEETVFRLFLFEGVLLGVLGWGIAVPVSAGLMPYLLTGVSETVSTLFVQVPAGRLRLNPWEVGLSFGVTLAVSTAAAWQPAREAMRVDPVEAMAVAYGGKPKRSAGGLALAGLVCVALVWPLSVIPGRPGFPLPGYGATFLLFVGFALTAPWGLARLGRITSGLFRRVGGMPAFLAARYVRDSDLRTAISVGALITAVALYAALVIMIHSFRGSVDLWAHQTVSGDLFVRTRNAALNHYRDLMSPRAVDLTRRPGPGIDSVPYRRIELRRGSVFYLLEAMDAATFLKHGRFNWVAGNPETARAKLARGEGVVVSEVFSAHTGLSVGDRYQARTGSSDIDLPILGVIRDYRTRGGVVFSSFDVPDKTAAPAWSGARFFIRDQVPDAAAATADLRRRFVECCGAELEITEGRDLRRAILEIFDETFAVTTVLLLIALLVAALGIATTLTVLVLERTRELNTLLAVGGSKGQVRAMITWEAMLIVLAGQIAGLACGFILSWLLVYVINYHSFGWTFLYRVDWSALAMSLPLIILTALVAAVPAIGQAFREPPASLLRER